MALGNNLKGVQKANIQSEEVQEIDLQEEQKKGMMESESWVDAAELSKINAQISEKKVDRIVTLVVFPIGKEQYALSIERVKEVVKVPKVTRISQTPDFILGVGNIRGEVICIIDLEKRLYPNRKEAIVSEDGFVIIVKDEDIKAGFYVSKIPNTLLINESQIDTTSALVTNVAQEDAFFHGIVRRKEDMIVVFDIIKLLEQPI
jgi:purine-binding chemotaxis protein CheW